MLIVDQPFFVFKSVRQMEWARKIVNAVTFSSGATLSEYSSPDLIEESLSHLIFLHTNNPLL